MLIVETPDGRPAERKYISDVLLCAFLGLRWKGVAEDRTDVRVTIAGHQGEIRLPDIFFSLPEKRWLTAASLPLRPLATWDTRDIGLAGAVLSPVIPLIYGGRPPCAAARHDSLYLPADIFGSAFFMLTRYEEVVKPERDTHGRFPAWNSLAFQENFLLRPIVDEYVEILWAAMKRTWPGLERKKRCFRMVPTHDVDNPFDPVFQSPKKLIRTLGGDLLKRRRLFRAANRFFAFIQIKRGKRRDPFDTFDWLMDQSEKAGVRSAFYFKAATNGDFDTAYSLFHPRIQDLFHKMQKRGHEVGFHPGYQAADDPAIWRTEYALLRAAIPSDLPLKGGRQHFLRFQVPETWRCWADSALEYDATMGFADQAGFRCGTCHAFSVFDVTEKRLLNIVEKPLIVMEGSVLDKQYMGIQDAEAALDCMRTLKSRCRRFEGTFLFLWHNSRVVAEVERNMYQTVLLAES